MKKVVTVINQYVPFSGGAENIARFIVEQSNAAGTSNNVLTIASRGIETIYGKKLPLQERTDKNYTIYRFRYAKLRGKEKNGRFFIYITLLKYIYHLIKLRKTYDLIHAHTYYLSTAAAIIAAKLVQKPVIVTGHSTLDQLKKEVERGQIPAFLLSILKHCDCYVAINRAIEQEAQTLCSITEDKIKIIYNGIDTRKFHPVRNHREKSSLRSRLGLPPDRPIIVYHGRLDQNKNIQSLLIALSEVRGVSSTKPYLVILGQGPYKERLQKDVQRHKLTDNVWFAGFKDNIHEYLQAADIYCLPSLFEGLSLALLEAMACGLVCLASDIEGNREAIDNRVNGLLFQAEETKELQAVLSDTLVTLDGQNCQKIRQKARQTVVERFDLDKMVNNYLMLYENFIY